MGMRVHIYRGRKILSFYLIFASTHQLSSRYLLRTLPFFIMKTTFVTLFAAFAHHSLASAIPSVSDLVTRQNASCENTATSRRCWGGYSIDTDYYSVTPDTGVTREV